MRERRQFPRIPQVFQVQFRPFGQLMESWCEVIMRNLSAGGIRFRHAEPLDVGSILELQMQLPTDPQPLILQGRVVWSQLQASGASENGIEFLEVTPEQRARIDRMVQFLQRPNA